MRRNILAVLLLLIPLPGLAKTIIDPISFEQIWLLNNQRNLYKRYYYYNEQVAKSSQNVYLIGIDAASDKVIKTSEGDKDALLSRINIYYQSLEYLFLIDWFSAIPQPQTTEGFTYGDLVAGYTWRFPDDNYYLTLGLRQNSTPRVTTLNSEIVFDAVSDATEEDYSVFFHLNYEGLDFGTYYSEDGDLESIAFHKSLLESEDYTVAASLSYYGDMLQVNLSERYEVSLDLAFKKSEHDVNAGIIAAFVQDLDKYDVTNVFVNYQSPAVAGVRFDGGLYYYYDVENDETLPGAKLGLVWQLDSPESIRFSFGVQQNAIGDFNALIIRDEPVFTFSISSGASDSY